MFLDSLIRFAATRGPLSRLSCAHATPANAAVSATAARNMWASRCSRRFSHMRSVNPAPSVVRFLRNKPVRRIARRTAHSAALAHFVQGRDDGTHRWTNLVALLVQFGFD